MESVETPRVLPVAVVCSFKQQPPEAQGWWQALAILRVPPFFKFSMKAVVTLFPTDKTKGTRWELNESLLWRIPRSKVAIIIVFVVVVVVVVVLVFVVVVAAAGCVDIALSYEERRPHIKDALTSV